MTLIGVKSYDHQFTLTRSVRDHRVQLLGWSIPDLLGLPRQDLKEASIMSAETIKRLVKASNAFTTGKAEKKPSSSKN